MPGSKADQRFIFCLKLCAIFCAGVVMAILGFLLYFTWPIIQRGEIVAVFSLHWQPYQGQFGIIPMFIGSLCLAFLSMLIAYPLGIGISLFVCGLGPRFLTKPISRLVQFMAGVPTVVYGFVAAFSLVPFLRKSFPYGTGFCLLAASLTLALLLLPTIVLVLITGLKPLQDRLRLTYLGLGLNTKQALLHIVLPSTKGCFLAAGILGFGRALGDTLISLMLAGNAPQIPSSWFDSIRTLTAHIALVVATDSQSAAYNSVFTAGLILFLVSLSTNLILYYLHGKTKN